MTRQCGTDKNSLLLPPVVSPNTPSLPAPGNFKVFSDANGILYILDSTGAITAVSPIGISGAGAILGQVWTADGANGAGWQPVPPMYSQFQRYKTVATVGGDYPTVFDANADAATSGQNTIIVFGNVTETQDITFIYDTHIHFAPGASWRPMNLSIQDPVTMSGSGFNRLGNNSGGILITDPINFDIRDDFELANLTIRASSSTGDYVTITIPTSIGDILIKNCYCPIQNSVNTLRFSYSFDADLYIFSSVLGLGLDANGKTPSTFVMRHSTIREITHSTGFSTVAGNVTHSNILNATNLTVPANGLNIVAGVSIP